MISIVLVLLMLSSCASTPVLDQEQHRGDATVPEETFPGGETEEPPVAERTSPAERDRPRDREASEDRQQADAVSEDRIADLGQDHDRVAVVDTSGVPPPERPDPLPREALIEHVLASMSLEQRVGQLFMPAILVDTRGETILRVNGDVRAMLNTVHPGGVILFGPNLRDPEQTRALVQELQEVSSYPLFVAVDQEGGVVSRLTSSEDMPATEIPSARRVGLADDEELTYQVSRAMAREMRALGITMNFAPVADVLTNPDNPVIGSRSYGSDPELVSRMVAAAVRGFQDGGVSAVVKHFPGHGDTSLDTHTQAVMVPHALDRLRQVEFAPFVSGFAAGADGVMTAHVGLPAVTGDGTPSTLSSRVLRVLLREDLGYEGLIITDSLVMGALTDTAAIGGVEEKELPLEAFRAGADILLYPRFPEESHRVLLDAVRRGEIDERTINEAVRRILQVKFERGLLLPGDPETQPVVIPDRFFPEGLELGVPEHRDLVQEVYRRSR